ncbi:olfactory receptor 10T2-like [Oryctolagus cuniculus]|uniref:olfactory receptor 10T2-like n=1 Tax=Oryctolagus cuniculus TaxID=9986 RepID=UPI003879D95E
MKHEHSSENLWKVDLTAANVSIILAIKLSHSLHTPMYFFLFGLSLSETCTTMVIIPRVLVDLLSKNKTISLPECATQMFFFFGLGGNNCFILAAMSYDRYTAIHNPLCYPILMTRKVWFLLMMASCIVGILISLCIITIVFNLSYCDSNIVQHFFCDIAPVVHLACDYTSYHEMAIYMLSAFVLLSSVVLIMVSYVFIITVIMKMPSTEGSYKAFSTCSSHFTAVSIHYGFACFGYLRPKESDTFREDMLMAVTYTMLTPLLNPIVYTLRNKEMRTALKKVLDNGNQFVLHLANKREQSI